MPAQLNTGRLKEFCRFLLVGGLSALANTFIIVLLTELLRINYLISYGICFIGVSLLGFLANRLWSFRVARAFRMKDVGYFYGITIGSTALAMAVSAILVWLGMAYPFAVFLSAGLVAPLNFILHRQFSFGENRT